MSSDILDPRGLSVQGYCTWTVESTGQSYDSRDLGLILTDVEVSDPAARRFEVEVPGRDGALDLTESLGGVYYDNRTVKLSFACVNHTVQRHHILASDLRNLLDGRLVRCVLYDDPGYFWRGRCQVDVERPGAEHDEITVEMDAQPHKLSIQSSYESWRWDPFSFEDGVIVQVDDIELSSSTETVTLPIDPARGKPIIWLNAGSSGSVSAKLSTDSTWHVLRAGKNTVPEIRMSDRAEVTLQLTGTGTVGVEYRVGSL